MRLRCRQMRILVRGRVADGRAIGATVGSITNASLSGYRPTDTWRIYTPGWAGNASAAIKWCRMPVLPSSFPTMPTWAAPDPTGCACAVIGRSMVPARSSKFRQTDTCPDIHMAPAGIVIAAFARPRLAAWPWQCPRTRTWISPGTTGSVTNPASSAGLPVRQQARTNKSKKGTGYILFFVAVIHELPHKSRVNG